MYIFLGIVGEIATVVGSVAINLNGASNSILEIAKKGYKVNKNVLEEYQKKHAEEAKEKSNGFNGVLAIVCGFFVSFFIVLYNSRTKKVKTSAIIKNCDV